MAADTLKILAVLPTERAVQLDLDEVDRPIAFSLPLASDDFDPKHSFDLSGGQACPRCCSISRAGYGLCVPSLCWAGN